MVNCSFCGESLSPWPRQGTLWWDAPDRREFSFGRQYFETIEHKETFIALWDEWRDQCVNCMRWVAAEAKGIARIDRGGYIWFVCSYCDENEAWKQIEATVKELGPLDGRRWGVPRTVNARYLNFILKKKNLEELACWRCRLPIVIGDTVIPKKTGGRHARTEYLHKDCHDKSWGLVPSS